MEITLTKTKMQLRRNYYKLTKMGGISTSNHGGK